MPLTAFSTSSLSDTGSTYWRRTRSEHIAEKSGQPVSIGSIGVLGEGGIDGKTARQMACEQTGGRTDGHTGKEGGAEQHGGAEPPRAIVHPNDPLIAMTGRRAASAGAVT